MTDELLDNEFFNADEMDFGKQVDFNFDRLLAGGEQIVWIGQPKKGIVLYAPDWAVVPMSIFFVGFSAYWLYVFAIMSAGFLLGILILAIFLLISMYILVGRFWYAAYRKSRVYYALTDKRLIWVTDYKRKMKWDLKLTDIAVVEIKQRPSQYGHLLFNGCNLDMADLMGMSLLDIYQTEDHYFEMIPEVEKVAQLIQLYRQHSHK
ncbi:MAG: hypothetical protein AAF598_04560 [Bacteroidota bacterium]